MTPNENRQNRSSGSGLQMWVTALLALALLASWMMGYGPGGTKCSGSAASISGATAPVPASIAAFHNQPAAASATATSMAASSPKVEAAVGTADTPNPAPPAADPVGGSDMAPPVARVYFAVSKSSTPSNAKSELEEVVRYLKAHPKAKLNVSGFHDPSGDAEQNAVIAQQRARSVQTLLETMGVSPNRIALKKAGQTVGSGTPQEARRVEVVIVQP